MSDLQNIQDPAVSGHDLREPAAALLCEGLRRGADVRADGCVVQRFGQRQMHGKHVLMNGGSR